MTIRVHALEESGDYKPWGDCYAPQVVLTSSWSGYNTHALNEEYLPFDAKHVEETLTRFMRSLDDRDQAFSVTVRYYRAFHGIEVHYKESRGHNQGDWGHSFVFATPEWLEMTGAPGVRESDHNDFCAWLWGDVYEVFNDDPKDFDERCPGGDVCWEMTKDGDPIGVGVISAVTKDCPMIVYGMDQAREYGDITFPTHRTITTYEYD